MNQKRLSLLLLVLVLSLTCSGVAQAQTMTLYWQRYDVDITVLADGDMRVVETQELVFTSGTFRFGERVIPLYRLDDIGAVTVAELDGPEYTRSEMDAPYTYRTYSEGNNLVIRYNFPASNAMRRTIVIGYTVSGALRYYPDNGVDQLYWKAVPADNPFPTQSSTITLHVPEPATFTNYGIYGAEAEAVFQPGQRDAVIQVRDRIDPGEEVEVVAEWQHGIVAGQPAAWQRQLDAEAAARAAREQFNARWGPVFTLGFTSLGGLLALGGPVLLYLWWYRRGRDKPVGLVADYLPEPPSDLPPGIVGTLIDERADMQDILSTLLDLGKRGVLEIEEVKAPGFLGIGTSTDFIYRFTDRSQVLRPHEQLLVDKLFGKETEVKLSSLKEKFYTAIPALRSALYKAVVDEGLFKESPDATRTRYGVLGALALVAAFFIGVVLVGALGRFSDAIVCVPMGLGLNAIGIIILARHMPRRTEAGAEAYARWSAFKRYLQNLEKYTKVEEAADIFSNYLPYAVAFGLEQSFIRKFQNVQAPPPPWWIPSGYGRPYYDGNTPSPARGGRVAGSGKMTGRGAPIEGGAPPSLDNMSKGLGTSLAGIDRKSVV